LLFQADFNQDLSNLVNGSEAYSGLASRRDSFSDSDSGSAKNGTNVLKINAHYLPGENRKTRAELAFGRVSSLPLDRVTVVFDGGIRSRQNYFIMNRQMITLVSKQPERSADSNAETDRVEWKRWRRDKPSQLADKNTSRYDCAGTLVIPRQQRQPVRKCKRCSSFCRHFPDRFYPAFRLGAILAKQHHAETFVINLMRSHLWLRYF
jgi:hypothetical protein